MQLALGWTILHSLWQGAIIALMLAFALAVIRSSGIRYVAACLTMLAVLAAFAITFAGEMQTVRTTAVVDNGHVSGAAIGLWERARTEPSRNTAAALLPWLTPFWIAGVIAFHLHSLASWLAARRMVRRGVCSAPDLWLRRLANLRERLRLSTPVLLLESSLANVPVVIGHLRPAILLPVGLLTGMPAAQVEAILLHELSHIRRSDYLVNLLQTAVEGFLFYHPVVWWISRVIRTERENCCDDLVVATSGDPHQYAVALTALEQNRWAATDAVLAANGGNLMKRIRRLLYPANAPRAVWSPILSAAILTVTAALALTAWQQAKPQDNSSAPREKNPYIAWLNEDVAYIISDQERAAYLRLQTDEERKMFIHQFWLRRDPTPGTEENEARQEHYRRIAYANDHFLSGVAGWKTDRGRIYIVHGPPDAIESHPGGGDYQRPAAEGGGHVNTYPFEQWLYRHFDGVGDNIVIEFVDPARTGAYHMSPDPQEKVIRN